MNTKTALMIAAALAAGYFLGKRMGAKPDTGPTARNEIETPADWWTYAGTWA